MNATAMASMSKFERVRCLLGYALVVETAFQFLLQAWSRTLEVFLFVTIVAAFLLATFAVRGLKGLVGIVMDTWTQRLAALAVAALALTFLWGDQSSTSVLALLRLPTYLVIIALVAETVRDERRVVRLAWTIIGAISALYALALVELLLGSAVLGLNCTDVEACWDATSPRFWDWPGVLGDSPKAAVADAARWQRAPDTLLESLRATVIGAAYGMNRLLFFALLAYTLAIGIVLTARQRRAKLLAAGLVAFVFCGVVLTESRSTLVIVAVFILLAAIVGWTPRLRRQLRPIVLTSATLLIVVVAFWQAVPGEGTTIDRIAHTARAYRQGEEVESDQARLTNWTLALDLFVSQPFGGSGFRNFPNEARERLFDDRPAPDRIGGGAPLAEGEGRRLMGYQNVGVHSGYLKVLAEAGLLGMVPFVALLVFVTKLTFAKAPMLSESTAVWQMVFAATLAGILMINLVDTHTGDQYFWTVLGFVAALEHWRRHSASNG